MQAGISSLLPLAAGQRYRVNSFDLGFINILPVDMEVGIQAIDAVTNEIVLVPLPISGQEPYESFLRIARWFREEYPAKSGMSCLLRSAGGFQRLVDCGVAVRQVGEAGAGVFEVARASGGGE